jgi:hypothetical protein
MRLAHFTARLRHQPTGFYPPHVLFSEARRVGPFRSLAGFRRRTKRGRRAVEVLVWAGAFDGRGVPLTALVGDRLRRMASICLAWPVVLQSPWNKKTSRSA